MTGFQLGPKLARASYVLVTLVSFWATACALAATPASFPSPLLGQDLPALGNSLSGASVDPAALRGKVVVVDFFAEYCKPCESLLPALNALQRDYPDVVFIGVSLDEQQSRTRELIARHGLTFAVVHDRSRRIAGRFRVRELPVTFLVNAQGRVHWVAGPDHTPADLQQALDSIL